MCSNSIKTYEDGLENMSSKSKKKLTLFFIDHLLAMRKTASLQDECIINSINVKLEKIFIWACDQNILSSGDHYFEWVCFMK